MKLESILKNSKLFLKSNSPELLTGAAIIGVVTTAYLTARASFTAADVLESESPQMPLKEKARHTWKLYIPAGVSGVVTIGCMVGASKASAQRTTAAVTAYSLTERAFNEYREKVVDELGKNKEQKIRDAVAQDAVLSRSAPGIVLSDETGEVVCCELYTRRYFRSDMETLRRAQNDINALVVQQRYVPLDEFYDLIDLAHTSVSDKLGWDSDKLMELKFTSTLTDSGRPCLAFDYNYVKPL